MKSAAFYAVNYGSLFLPWEINKGYSEFVFHNSVFFFCHKNFGNYDFLYHNYDIFLTVYICLYYYAS